ncbi:hypothetical protein KP509_37G011300 [Ceratopteris richardii]|uniref:Secreted protein n=1 Tax=Ceratopteris richardii TaxID=49495 RepID=A0A8T2Q6F6_CERRI|nr:hypothetical protein KP509_37G011300 [Ceratopteris richardii]
MSTFLVLILSRFRSLSGQGFLPQASKSPSGIISTLSHCYTVFVLSEITASSNLSEAHDSFSARRCGIYRILVFRCENLQTLQRNAKVSFKILRGLRSSIRKKARQEEICLVVYLNLRSLLKKPCSSGKRDQQARKNYKCSFIFGACHLHQVQLLFFSQLTHEHMQDSTLIQLMISLSEEKEQKMHQFVDDCVNDTDVG